MENMIKNIAEQVEIDNGSYSFSVRGSNFKLLLLDTSVGFNTAQEVLKLVLPSLGAGADGIQESITELISQPRAFSEAAVYLTSQLNNVNVLNIIQTLLSGATVDGEPLDFDKYFRGKYGMLLEVVEKALEENFSDFFNYRDLKANLSGLVSILKVPNTKEQTSE